MRVFPIVAVAITVAFAIPCALGAQTGSRQAPAQLPVTHAVHAVTPVRLDGHLDDAAWAAAPVTTVFTQVDPDAGAAATQRTDVRVIYDGAALYIGARMFDSGRITGRLGRRDMNLGDSDWFDVIVDSYHDHRTAAGFSVNPAGVQRDLIRTTSQDDLSWDAVWRVATAVDSGGWTAEFRIPFSQLRFHDDSTLTWGIQFERRIGRSNELVVSTYTPKSDAGGVAAYGHLVGLERLTSGARVELLPYTVTRAEFVDPGVNPYRSRHEYPVSGGLDLRYRATSDLTVTGSFNPDFGQVEVDPAVVNLGVYETFFQEKRPLFLEGSEIFDFGTGNTSGGQLFYSRRIGRQPTLRAPTALADIPAVTSILGAGKLTGKVGDWSIGSLTAVTGRAEARYIDAGNVDRRFAVEPRSVYFVNRARRESNNGRSMIGAAATFMRRSLDTDALRANFRHEAGAGGVDFRHETTNRQWAFRGDVEGSVIRGTPASVTAVQRASNHYFQRPDALHLRVDSTVTALMGYGISTAVSKQAGVHWRGELAGAMTSPGYEVNDLGFSYRTDRRDAALSATYVEELPGAVFRRWQLAPSIRSEHNFAGEPILTIANMGLVGQTLGYWSVSGKVRRQFRSFDDRLTRGGPMAIRPSVTAGQVNVSTDARKGVTGIAAVGGTRDEAGGWSTSISAGLGVKTSDRWNLQVSPTLYRARVAEQYVSGVPDATYAPTFGRRYVFAPLSQVEFSIDTRLNASFTPRLSLETYVQPLISSGDYGAPQQLVAARTFDFVAYQGSIPNRDFNLRSLRGNSVLRWEWREGSTLYLAWQQARSDSAPYGDFDFERDRRALLGSRPDNIFILKVNYWLVP